LPDKSLNNRFTAPDGLNTEALTDSRNDSPTKPAQGTKPPTPQAPPTETADVMLPGTHTYVEEGARTPPSSTTRKTAPPELPDLRAAFGQFSVSTAPEEFIRACCQSDPKDALPTGYSERITDSGLT
jgi:hypothetical protein